MSSNLKILARNMRKEEEQRIIYKNRPSSWKTIFKHHPLESQKNEKFFKNIVHCVDHWGSGDISILRSAYTFENLLEISKNSLKDCITFYELAKNTILFKNGIMHEGNNNWFKKALTAFYLSNSNSFEELNFLSELKQEQKEQALALSFQYFGDNALAQYEKHKIEFNIDHLHEKLIFWYWSVDGSENNLIDQVIKKLDESKKIIFDTEYLADKFQPKNLLKPQSQEIDKRFVSFSDINVETKRYAIQAPKLFCIMNEEVERTSLKNIYNLFCCQSLIKQLEVNVEDEDQSIIMRGEVRKPNFASFLGEFKYSSLTEIFNDYPLTKELEKSMQGFIELNISQAKTNHNYWNEVQSIFLSQVLNNDLSTQEKLKNKKIKV